MILEIALGIVLGYLIIRYGWTFAGNVAGLVYEWRRPLMFLLVVGVWLIWVNM